MKDHYYYHCQMNPDGFKRLKTENFVDIGAKVDLLMRL